MSDLISRSALFKEFERTSWYTNADRDEIAEEILLQIPAVNAYTAHEVAEIIAEILGDPCACNFNSIDEWLPFKCELLDACPHTEGVACWEQYLKFKGERKDNG